MYISFYFNMIAVALTNETIPCHQKFALYIHEEYESAPTYYLHSDIPFRLSWDVHFNPKSSVCYILPTFDVTSILGDKCHIHTGNPC